jgi:hypothetical protein
MGEKIVVGPINKGIVTNRLPFVIDNDSFPTLINAYQWRGRVKRKRGTKLLNRLSRFIGTTDVAGNFSVTILPVPIATGIVSFVIGNEIFVDPGTTANPLDQILITNSLGAVHTLNRITGLLTITGSTPSTRVFYFPRLPVMGLEDLILTVNQFPGTLAFDTKYSYNILTSANVSGLYDIYDVSFYKNPVTADYPGFGYAEKTLALITPTTWNGQDYQQFWTVNYEGALWATNGITQPFNIENIGMQFAPASTITFVGVTATTLTVTISNCPLVIGDFVFVNEWTGVNESTLNFQSGYVTAAAPNTPALALKTITITFPNAAIGVGPYGPGIIQYLTNRSSTTVDCLRWYDGDPTDGVPATLALTGHKGWVNFAPPLSQNAYSIADLPEAKYYLVGAKMIIPFKDRLLFLGPVVQTSAAGSQVYLQDTIIYSQNGTPFYTASFSGAVDSAATIFHPILTPTVIVTPPTFHTAAPNAYWEDVTGFGGFIKAGVDQPINTASLNEDALIVGFSTLQTRLIYSGSDISPFNFFSVNSELGSGSTFSIINMDRGVITRGSRGIIITGQTDSQRIDLEIPDEVFQINLKTNGSERFTAIRDYINEWIYFTYPGNYAKYKFPNQSLLYNYRDQSWAIFREAYTTYGIFRRQTGLTWISIIDQWQDWSESWNAGENTLLQPDIIAGNQQGFILFRDEGIDEDPSLYIQNISGSTVTSPDHTLSNGDYIIISDVLGTLSAQVNGKTFQVDDATTSTFNLLPPLTSGTYLGGGRITRLYIPQIQTKQFPVSWGMSRKTRLGPQQYLLTKTPNAQITLQIFLSQNGSSPYNFGPIVPEANVRNDSLIYSNVLFTCPESTNLGLTPANINLNMVTASQQSQIWHRMNTSLLGDTVQVGFTMSDEQMRSLVPATDSKAITGITLGTTTVIAIVNGFSSNQLVRIDSVVGTTQLNYNVNGGNVYIIIDRTPTDITIDVDSTAFTAYDSGGTATVVNANNQFAEIELHGMILDVSQSMLLS